MVNRLRTSLPKSIDFIAEQAIDIRTSPDRQQVRFTFGRQVDARVIIPATGLERTVTKAIGIGRTAIRAAHSITIGFGIAPTPGTTFRIPLLTAFPPDVRHKIDYLAIFPIGRAWRANLFTNCGHQDELVQSFRSSPRDALSMGFPDLQQTLGPFTIDRPVQMRTNDLTVATDFRRDGLVLIGDAYRSSCPSTGTGISRLRLDVERLCLHHLPRWLAAGRADAAAVSAFYDDPAKVAFEREAARDAEYRRSVSIETGWTWQLHRGLLAVRQQTRGRLGGYAGLMAGLTAVQKPDPQTVHDYAGDPLLAQNI
jgi:hypothetical protein